MLFTLGRTVVGFLKNRLRHFRMAGRRASQSYQPKRDIGPFDKDDMLITPSELHSISIEELQERMPLSLELSDGQSSQGRVTVLSLGE